MKIEIRPNNRILFLISQIERESGRLETTFNKLSDLSFIDSMREGALEAALKLDSDFSPDRKSFLLSEFTAIAEGNFKSLITGDIARYISSFFSQILNHENLREGKSALRGGENFGILGGLVFETLAPYLVKNRFSEISKWLSAELLSSEIHPLLLIPSFQLLLLQCSPYKGFNQSLSQLFIIRLLAENGYPELASSNLASLVYQDQENYIKALRQAEKTAGTDWSTLNIYLEFFLEKALQALLELGRELATRNESAHLSSLQKQIVQVIRDRGALSREAIAVELSANPSTIKYNLGVLYEKGQLDRRGGGRSTTYCAK